MHFKCLPEIRTAFSYKYQTVMIFIYTIYFEELVIAFSEILSNRLIVESLK